MMMTIIKTILTVNPANQTLRASALLLALACLLSPAQSKISINPGTPLPFLESDLTTETGKMLDFTDGKWRFFRKSTQEIRFAEFHPAGSGFLINPDNNDEFTYVNTDQNLVFAFYRNESPKIMKKLRSRIQNEIKNVEALVQELPEGLEFDDLEISNKISFMTFDPSFADIAKIITDLPNKITLNAVATLDDELKAYQANPANFDIFKNDIIFKMFLAIASKNDDCLRSRDILNFFKNEYKNTLNNLLKLQLAPEINEKMNSIKKNIEMIALQMLSKAFFSKRPEIFNTLLTPSGFDSEENNLKEFYSSLLMSFVLPCSQHTKETKEAITTILTNFKEILEMMRDNFKKIMNDNDINVENDSNVNGYSQDYILQAVFETFNNYLMPNAIQIFKNNFMKGLSLIDGLNWEDIKHNDSLMNEISKTMMMQGLINQDHSLILNYNFMNNQIFNKDEGRLMI